MPTLCTLCLSLHTGLVQPLSCIPMNQSVQAVPRRTGSLPQTQNGPKKYQVRIWVLRPVTARSPAESEFYRTGSKWQFVRMPSDLRFDTSERAILTAFKTRNPNFRADSVLDRKTAEVNAGSQWEYAYSNSTHFTIVIPANVGRSSRKQDTPTHGCRVNAFFAEVPEPSKNAPDATKGCRYTGRFDIPENRIVMFNAGERFDLGPPGPSKSGKSERSLIHTPRDLLLISIRPRCGESSPK